MRYGISHASRHLKMFVPWVLTRTNDAIVIGDRISVDNPERSSYERCIGTTGAT